MPTSATSRNDNVDLVRRGIEAINANDLDACLALMTDDFIINLAGLPYPMQGHDAWTQNFQVLQHAFPGITVTIDDIFGSDDRVAVRATLRGTHRGEFQGITPTGRDVTFTSIELYRVVDGKLAEEWIATDIASLMQQLTEPVTSNTTRLGQPG